MFSFLHGVIGFFNLLVDLANFLILGAVIAGAGFLIGRWFSPVLACVVGAAIMFFAVTGHWVGENQDKKIARLEAENHRLEAKKLELELTGEALRKTLSELSEASEHNEGVIERLQATIGELADAPNCTIPKEFTDDLKSLR